MIAIVGVGKVGSSLAYILAEKGLDDMVLVDITEGLARGEAMDISQTCDTRVKVTGSRDIRDIKGARVVVITAGLARTPRMKERTELLRKNARTVRGIAGDVKKLAPRAVVLVVTNPVDIMTRLVLKETGFPRRRVMGMGGLLDSQRFRSILSEDLHTTPLTVRAMVIGEHGDSMVPLISGAKSKHRLIQEMMPRRRILEDVERTRHAGAKVIGLKGYTSWAPAEAVAAMVEDIVKDRKRTVPASVYLEGEYGMEGICIGVPVRLGRRGVEKIIKVKLTENETEEFRKSGEKVRKVLGKL